jgi:hypothetical protein
MTNKLTFNGQDKYAFTKTDEHGDKISVETSSESLSDIISAFQDFLFACGFRFDGELAIMYDAEEQEAGHECCNHENHEPDNSEKPHQKLEESTMRLKFNHIELFRRIQKRGIGNICNDLEPEEFKLLTKNEWIEFASEYYKWVEEKSMADSIINGKSNAYLMDWQVRNFVQYILIKSYLEKGI